jgi:hypothetical protein
MSQRGMFINMYYFFFEWSVILYKKINRYFHIIIIKILLLVAVF